MYELWLVDKIGCCIAFFLCCMTKLIVFEFFEMSWNTAIKSKLFLLYLLKSSHDRPLCQLYQT